MAEEGMKVAKALIIGLGSAGQSVCENIAKNLNSKYGDYKNAKWLGIKVLETAYKSDTLHKEDFINLSVDSSSFKGYTSGAPSAGIDFAWKEWGDFNLIRNVGSCINSGAGNVRMAGRLALFHNYDKIKNSITSELRRLNDLRAKTVQEALQTNKPINFGDQEQSVPIYVYVIASLCGGTGSGCCVDMGYLIREWDDNVRTIAFFTLPHPALKEQVLKKNAFTALTELNHFCLENNIWEQKLPDKETPSNASNQTVLRPYHVIYLTSPANHTTNEKAKNEQTIASFLIALTSETSQDLAAANVDGENALINDVNIGYLKPYFSTFGIASLEYPGEHITRMCKEKILQKLFGYWKDDQLRDSSKGRNELFEENPQKVVNYLRDQSEIKSKYEKEMKAELDNLETPKDSSIHNKIKEIFSDIENKIRKDSNLTTKADKWIKDFKTRLEKKFEEILDAYLVSLDGGPGYISRILKKGKEDIDSWVASKGDVNKALDRATDKLEIEKNNIKTITENCLNTKEDTGFLGIGNLFNKNKTPNRDSAWQNVKNKCVELVEKIVNLVVTEKLKEFIESYGTNYSIQKIYSTFASKYITRLDRFESAIESLYSFHQAEYKKNCTNLPKVNGHQFLLNDDVEAEINYIYKRVIDDWKKDDEPTMPSEVREKEMCAEIIKDNIKDSLINEIKGDSSNFDTDTDMLFEIKDYIINDIQSRIEIRANQYFKDLSKYRYIVNEIKKDVSGYIDIIRRDFQPSLKFSTAPTSDRFRDIGKPTINDFSYALCPQTETPNDKNLNDLLTNILNYLQIELGTRKEPIDNKDLYRIMGIRTSNGASLAHIPGIFKVNEKDNNALEDSKSYNKFSCWNTRKDIIWTNCLISNESIDKVRRNWIVFTLIGSPMNEKWYELKQGKFEVELISAYNDKWGKIEIEQDFNKAVKEIVSNDIVQTRVLATCENRINSYINQVGKKGFVDKIFDCLEKIDTYYINITKEDAKPYLVEYCIEDGGLEQNYYDNEFPEDEQIDPAKKDLLRLFKGKNARMGNGENAPRDGYFCQNGHPLDDNIPAEYIEKYGDRQQAIFRKMINDRFICQRCKDNRYWPYEKKGNK